MRIIGIDPGYDRIGIAIIDKQSPRESLVFSTCITTSSKIPFTERLLTLGKTLERIIVEYQPVEAAVEMLYFAKNSTTALAVAEARGVIQYLLTCYNIAISEYHPNTIKLAITGYGSADKRAITNMIPRLIQVGISKKLDDELDAIAVALTHSAHQNSHYPQEKLFS